jgi:acyl-CoA thioester hydrolase
MTHRVRLDIADVKQLPMTHRATIPEEYLDEMGHMNVMWYTHLFSMAMGGMFQSIGLSWDDLEAIHGGTFALESHIRYLSEVRVGQTVEIHSRLIGRSEKRFHAILFMTNQDKGDVSATFEFIGAYVDLRARRMAAIPDQATALIDQLASQNDALTWEAPVCGVMKP